MTKFFDHIEELITKKITIFKIIIAIFKLEARLAGLSIYPLLLNLCMLFIVIITLWFSIMFVIGYFAMLFLETLLLTALIIICINLILLFALLKYLAFNLNNMSFEKTRASFSTKENSEDDKLKKTITNRN